MDARDLMVSASVITTAAAAATTTRSSTKHNCQAAINLPPGGVLYIPGADPVTLTATAAYRPLCVPTDAPAILGGSGSAASSPGASTTSTSSLSTDSSNLTTINIDETADTTPQYSDFRDPFYASTFPQCYALASTTVIAYTLVIMLFITPRSFLDGGVVVLGRRGFTNGGSGGKNIGGRPWLQKVAALTVAISLTIATADTFRVAESQYSWGIQNAKEMQDEVLGGTELKVIRIISDTFLWLAQAQTLIRLFPRQREKVIIKWTAFSLITLDVIFDCLNSFLYASTNHSFTDAIPALSYLFELALGVLYAAWVIYYSLMKKRYAYYHPRMKNICLVAMLSLLAILVPIVFFVLDICKPDFTGWGDYALWVGAAAASVIVWEWVERIEALEREEKKDGILGREVFDGDEMLDIMPSDFSWPRKRRSVSKDGKSSKDVSEDGDGNDGGNVVDGNDNGNGAGGKAGRIAAQLWPSMSKLTNRYRVRPWRKDPEAAQGTALHDLAAVPSTNRATSERADANSTEEGTASGSSRRPQPPLWPQRPAPAATPVSRTDTASADSTVYVMRYHPVSDSGLGSTSGTAQHTQPITLSRSNSTSSTSSASQERPPRTTISFMSSQSETPNVLAPGSPLPQHSLRDNGSTSFDEAEQAASVATEVEAGGPPAKRWRSFAHTLSFRRGGASSRGAGDGGDESESAGAGPSAPLDRNPDEQRMQHEEGGRWDIRQRFEEFAATQAEKLRERIRPTVDTTGLPVMVIPAPQRNGAMLTRVLEEEENSQQEERQQQQQQQQRQRYDALVQRNLGQNHDAPELWRSNSNTSASSLALSRRTRVTALDEPPAVVQAALSRTGSDSSRHGGDLP